MLALIVIAASCAVLLIAVLALQTVGERAEVRESLRRLETYQIQGVRDQEMLEPVGERVVAPVARWMTSVMRRHTPQGYVEVTRRKLVFAGSPPNLDVDRLLVFKMLGILSGLIWIPVVVFALKMQSLSGFLVIAILWAASFMGPDLVVSRMVDRRKHAIAIQLPDLLDLLVISVEAGLGFEQALDRTSAAVPGPLSAEFRRMLQETRIGSSRAQALRAMEERTDVPELRSFILAMLQADTFGVSIGRILRTQAEDMRVRRRVRAQEQAQKAPVKMLFPLVFCVFPAIFVVVLGPAMINISKVL